jgi:cell division septation protein DedD
VSKPSTRVISLTFIISLLTISLPFAHEASRSAAMTNPPKTQSASSPASSRMVALMGTLPNVTPVQDENWYVIVGSYPKAQEKKAKARARYFNGKGYAAFVADSDYGYSLTPGLWVVLMGPFSQSRAKQVLNNVRSFDKNAYVKQSFFGT